MAPTILPSSDGHTTTFSTKSDFLLFCFGIGTLLASLIGLFVYFSYCLVRFLSRPESPVRKWFSRNCDASGTNKPDDGEGKKQNKKKNTKIQGNSNAAAPPWALAYQIHLNMDGQGHQHTRKDQHGMPMLHTPQEFRGLGLKLDTAGNVEPQRPLRVAVQDSIIRPTLASQRAQILISRESTPRNSLDLTRASYARKSGKDHLPVPTPLWCSPEVDEDDSNTEEEVEDSANYTASSYVGIAS